MGEHARGQSSGLGGILKRSSWVLLTAQYTAFVSLLHYSRVMTPTGGKRYLTSTAVFLNEVAKLAISLTIALYEVSRSAPPSMPATSLLFSLSSAVFSGDSWKLAIPASLYTLANSLQYIALSNMQPATFQVTYQLKLLVTSAFGLMLLRRTLPLRKWAFLMLLAVGVYLVQMPDGTSDEIMLEHEAVHHSFPRSFEEWKAVTGKRGNLHKRSATYEGIEEDLLTALPRLNSTIGLLATIGACLASGLAGVYFEKVLRDSAKTTSLWVRNVQLSVYSLFPALFIGVVFLDGEKVAANGFFEGYNWAVWSTILLQAIGGLATSFCINFAYKDARNVATATSIVLSTFGSIWFFGFELTGNFIFGTFAVIVATYLFEDFSLESNQTKPHGFRPPPIRVERFEKDAKSDEPSPVNASPNEFSIKLPSTPFLSQVGLSTSRPTSPGVARLGATRTAGGGYFDK
ncbi:putative UDP-galactose transporter [Aspergillus clavatus NRRL 1]|uniref:Udp-galactose transporter n=1 Tax=Aspergillus clavatus (strain ATCC 1007 / CBS 513.65 / DSM 816 / NCTC 3887 / NRRL 1 / QM 1276 / 107) TaxID=344612 RepID=A1CUE6_ASPCL|nr:udp-galactose transporter [Aspergillus clavatus NRRL 1]EAW06933.1 udp-galactose transporter [Aspergillus clavatus NRRL 1]